MEPTWNKKISALAEIWTSLTIPHEVKALILSGINCVSETWPSLSGSLGKTEDIRKEILGYEFGYINIKTHFKHKCLSEASPKEQNSCYLALSLYPRCLLIFDLWCPWVGRRESLVLWFSMFDSWSDIHYIVNHIALNISPEVWVFWRQR